MVSGFGARSPNFAQSQSPTTPSITKVPFTSPGVVNTSPPGRFPHFSGLMIPLVLIHRYAGLSSAVKSVPTAVFARIREARRTISTTFWLIRSTFRKSARMPSSMIWRLMLTMCACLMWRRFTISVICMRERSSLASFPSGSHGFGEAGLRLCNHIFDNLLQISSFLKYSQLPVGAAPRFQNLSQVIQFLTRVELVHHILDKIQIFVNQIANRHFLLLAEVD